MRTKLKFRHERKYCLTRADAAVVRGRVVRMLKPDANAAGPYHISSLYFDDAHDTALHEKLNGVFMRDKWRLRWYNGNFGFIRLERKQKRGDLACKEHAAVSEAQFRRLRAGDISCAAEGNEPVWRAFYARHLLGVMRPVVTVEYDREAFSYAPGNVRITFDAGLRAAAPGSSCSVAVDTDGLIIMELKYDGFLPAVAAGLLSGMQFTQLALSKYVMARRSLRCFGYE
ncbi:MAG: polyphosphate polymerase domain-containing protein [Desulfovibrio sp.]|nr:polyphosphate polymerase domain-containing protein [Desulfovibrio sp.]